MPSVIDTSERLEDVDVHDLYEEQPQVRVTHPGFWRTLVQYMRRHRVHTSSRTRSSGRVALRQLESPMERLARENPTLFLQGFCGIHNG
jgi:hypothetical protein